MYRVCYQVTLDRSLPDQVLTDLVAAAVEGLARVDAVILRHFSLPPLYSAGVRYRYERVERWKDIGAVMHDRAGDCKDFTAWRLAELWRTGTSARAEVSLRREGAALRFHAYLRLPDGRVEDPARILGMP